MNEYQELHRKLRSVRGNAVGRPCIAPGCTRLADGWGLLGESSCYGEDGRARVRWSKDLDDYAPMCASHNAQLDRGGDWELCPSGHHRATWGTTTNGSCRGCSRESSRAAYARRREARANKTLHDEQRAANGQQATPTRRKA